MKRIVKMLILTTLFTAFSTNSQNKTIAIKKYPKATIKQLAAVIILLKTFTPAHSLGRFKNRTFVSNSVSKRPITTKFPRK